MSNFKQLQAPFSKYEISENRTVIRGIKNKSIVSLEKGSLRLYNDSGERVAVRKEDFDRLMITTDETPAQNEQPEQGVVTYKTPDPVEKPKLKVLKKPSLKKPEKEKKPKAEKPKVEKEKKVKVEFVPTAKMVKILEMDVSKAKKMQPLRDAGAPVAEIALMLKTNYSYVANFLKGYYSRKK